MTGFVYRLSRSNIAASVSISAITLIPAAARHFRVRRIKCVGMGTVSLAQEVLLSKVNAAGVGAATAVTPRPLDGSAPAAALTANFVYATSEPTLLSDLCRLSFNNNGGVDIWSCKNDMSDAIEVQPNTTGVTLRGAVSTGSFSFEMDIEEL